ncbi:hypothetical protein FRC15_000784 [Serendipita sp. 397]|nr:hypothetical protein FRC15_000784 [Serendipita sp. 397]
MTFRRPRDDGPNWLGGSVPFPMNPSFKPPPPISDKMRTQIFGLYTQNNHNEEWLSAKFGLSVSRIKAILRLKKLEQLWVKVGIFINNISMMISMTHISTRLYNGRLQLFLHLLSLHIL